MKLHTAELQVPTRGPGMYDVTADVAKIVTASSVTRGLCTVFIRHTSASLLIQENAAPEVQKDLVRWLAKVAPESREYEHDDEGPDDMPAHLKSAITRTSETMPIADGRLALGTWQALYVVEHRHAHHRRTLHVTVMGE